jgi:predicted lipoprotein
MNKALPAFIAFAVLVGLCWLFPPIRIRSLKEVREVAISAQFDAVEFVEKFWGSQLLPATKEAAGATEVLETIANDPLSVREQFGRTLGVSSSYFLFVNGVGKVVSVEEDGIGLSLRPDSDEVQIAIPLGFVFGNAVRDSTGLLDPGDYPNAQEFNDISAALNSRVESNVLTRLREIAVPGSRIRFAGCAEVADEEQDLKPLALVPIFVEPE